MYTFFEFSKDSRAALSRPASLLTNLSTFILICLSEAFTADSFINFTYSREQFIDAFPTAIFNSHQVQRVFLTTKKRTPSTLYKLLDYHAYSKVSMIFLMKIPNVFLTGSAIIGYKLF